MMMKYIHNHSISKALASCAVSGLLLSACTLDIPLEDQYSDPEAIATVSNARSLLTSAYAGYPHHEFDFAVLGPDFCPTSLTGKDADLKNLYNWQDNTISQLSQSLWIDLYNVIAICDVLQERFGYVEIRNEKDQQDLDAVRAESLALEAMSYFNLLRLFAPAYDLNPDADGIILKNRVGVEFPERSSLKDCVANIRALLLEAAEVKNAPDRNGWLSRQAVYYLLAELELYAGNYDQAAQYAEEVLSHCDSSFFTADAYAKLWRPDACDERIFAFSVTAPQMVSLQYDAEAGDYFALSPEVTFTESDYRKEYTVFPFTMNDESRQLVGKYNLLNKEGKSTAYLNMMRYAGAYFIAAEAYSHTEGKESVALQRVNEYLTYCGAEPLDGQLKGQALTEAIVKAKLQEFVGEGVLYFDYKRLHTDALLRWNKWGKMATSKIEPTDYRWTFPIPASEYKNNANVTQNEGWPINR